MISFPWQYLPLVDRLKQSHPKDCPYCQAWPSDLCALHRDNWVKREPKEAAGEEGTNA